MNMTAAQIKLYSTVHVKRNGRIFPKITDDNSTKQLMGGFDGPTFVPFLNLKPRDTIELWSHQRRSQILQSISYCAADSYPPHEPLATVTSFSLSVIVPLAPGPLLAP